MHAHPYLIAVSAAFFLAAVPAFATTENPVPAEPPSAFANAGTLLTTYSSAFSNTSESGMVYEDVFLNSGGTLDFYYQVSNDPASELNPSPDTIERLTVGRFTGFTVYSADYIEDTGHISPTVTGDVPPYQADLQNNNSSVGFDFGDEYDDIAPGETSDWVEVSTSATSYSPTGTISVIDSYTSTITGNPAPAPEPSTYALLGAGLLALLIAVRAQFRNS